MNELRRTGSAGRAATSADVKRALRAGFRPRPAVAATDFQPTVARRKARA